MIQENPDYTPEEILGLQPGASPDLIRRAFRQLALQYHPDTHPDDPKSEEIFKYITKAYHQLSKKYPELPDTLEETFRLDLNDATRIIDNPDGGQTLKFNFSDLRPVTPKARRLGSKG
jgi:curved DNA-binding protein CbpA